MKSKLPTILILVVMALIGAMYWVDLAYYTDADTGFITRGPVWVRFLVLLLPLVMAILGLRTVGPRGLSVLRTRNPVLGGLFALAAVLGAVYGVARLVAGAMGLDAFGMVLGAFCLWYGVWMFLAAMQLWTQSGPSPTKSALWGVLAALTFCFITVYRILVRPSSLHRVAPLVLAFSALFAMLWFAMLLRSLYIALPRGRLRWMYLLGAFTFLLCACLELPLAVYNLMFDSGTVLELLEALCLAGLGLAAGGVSVAIAGKSGAQPAAQEETGAP